jgi:hypothetical protein
VPQPNVVNPVSEGLTVTIVGSRPLATMLETLPEKSRSRAQ